LLLSTLLDNAIIIRFKWGRIGLENEYKWGGVTYFERSGFGLF